MAAFVLGYDVAARLCSAFTPWPLAHQNGQACLLAAVAAGARLRGLDAAGISRAMRIGVTLVLTPSYTNVVAGATRTECSGRHVRLCGRYGAGSCDSRIRRRRRTRLRKLYKIWLEAASILAACWISSAPSGTSPGIIFGCMHAATRSIRHWMH